MLIFDDNTRQIKCEFIQADPVAADEDTDEDNRELVWSQKTPSGPSIQGSTSPPSDVPRPLRTRKQEPRGPQEGERKHITVLFADIKDSTSLIEGLDAEDAQQLLSGAIDLMSHAVNIYEGTVSNNLGDGIMALFGAPLAHEDHAERACCAALEMQRAISNYAEVIRGRGGEDLRLRVGMNSGEVVIPRKDDDGRMVASAVGLIPHLASRMEQSAGPGKICMTQGTYKLVEDIATVEQLPAIDVKGISEPMEIFELLGVTTFPKRWQVAASRALTPWIGKHTDFDVLTRAHGLALNGAGQIVSIVGEAGVGKSRLIHEFIQSHCAEGWTVLESGAISYGKHAPYHPIIQLFRRYFKVGDADRPEKVRDSITSQIVTSSEGLEDVIPPLLALMDVLPEDDPFFKLDPKVQREQIINALGRLILYQCAGKPLVLVFEDLQWLDPDTQVFIDQLVDIVSKTGILLIVSYRPEYAHSWSRKSHYSETRLRPLLSKHTEEFLNLLMGDDEGLRNLKDVLMERSQGIPLFLEESVRSLAESEDLVGERGNYRIADSLSTIQVPDKVQAILEARIDRLPSEDKEILQCASVIGRQFQLVLLQALSDMSSEQLRQSLARLQAADYLYQTRLFPEPEYTFKHALTNEVAYNLLLRRRRSAYHATIGVAIENIFADSREEKYETLAHHFGLSAEDEKAVDYGLLAAEKMQRRWANHEALTYFKEADKRLLEMPPTEENQLRRIDAALKQSELNFALGQHQKQIESLAGIETFLETSGDPRRQASWNYWMGFLHSLTGGQLEKAIKYCARAAEIAEEHGIDEIPNKSAFCLAQVYYFAGDLQSAMKEGKRVLNAFETRGEIWWACRTLWLLSTVANAMGKWECSLQFCRMALEYGKSANDLRLKVVGTWRMGAVYIQMGDPNTGLYLCNEAKALSPTPYDAATLNAAVGHGQIKLGEMDAGIATLREAVEWLAKANLHYTRAIFALCLGEAYLRNGERLRASTIISEVLDTSRERGYKYLEAVGARLSGEYLIEDDPATALNTLKGALETFQVMGARNEEAKTLVALGTLYRDRKEPTKAQELGDQAKRIFNELGTLDGPMPCGTFEMDRKRVMI